MKLSFFTDSIDISFLDPETRTQQKVTADFVLVNGNACQVKAMVIQHVIKVKLLDIVTSEIVDKDFSLQEEVDIPDVSVWIIRLTLQIMVSNRLTKKVS